jgi:phage gp29-like protein
MISQLRSILKRPKMKELAVADRLAGALGGLGACNPDDLVGGRGYETYDRMQRDSQVRACLNIKKLSILSRGWQVHPASGDPEDARAAEFVRWCLEDMRGSVIDVLYNILDAVAKGFSISEINYKVIEGGPYDGMIGLDSIKSKDPAGIAFDTDEFLNLTAMYQGPGRDVKLPPEKFLLYTYMPRYESPFGTSDLRAAYRHWWSKDIILRFYNVYLEKYGSPTVVGAYTRGTPKSQQDDLLKVLDKIQQETAIVLPEDIKVELLEAQRGGDSGYLQAIEYHDRQIAKSILGQTLTTDEGMRYGSFALAKVHLDVLRMTLEKTKRDVEESVMQEQLIRRLVSYNFGPRPCPTFSLGTLRERDLTLLADVVTKLVTGGVVAPDEAWIREYLEIPAMSKGQ